jgi:hypothetical protein
MDVETLTSERVSSKGGVKMTTPFFGLSHFGEKSSTPREKTREEIRKETARFT